MLQLRPFQVEGVGFLRARSRALLADDMGLGKTIQTLVALNGEPAIVVCPPIAVGVWQREADRMSSESLMNYSITTCDKGLERFPRRGELFIMSWTKMPKHPNEAADPHRARWSGMERGTRVIFDEAHLFKNKSERTTRARILARGAAGVWLLTGTPIVSYATDLWNLLSLAGLQFEAFDSWDNFCRLYGGSRETIRVKGGGFRKVMKWGHPPADLGVERMEALSQVALRRTKQQVLTELPAKVEERITVSLPEPDEEIEAMAETIEGIDVEWAIRNRSSVEFQTLSSIRAALACYKADAANDIIESFQAAKEPLVVFSAFREPVERFGSREGWGKIIGGTHPGLSKVICDRFQRGSLKGVACTIAAAGTGITLTRSANVLFIDEDWTPALNAQAADRVYRYGQERNVRVIRLTTDHPIDRRVDEVIESKRVIIRETLFDHLEDKP